MTAGSLAVPVVKEFLTEVLKKYPSRPFEVPAGMIPVRGSNGQTEYLKEGTQAVFQSEGGAFKGNDSSKADGFYDPDKPVSYGDLFRDDAPQAAPPPQIPHDKKKSAEPVSEGVLDAGGVY
jgi:membrane carboxypeptidase/penicillin-binding protein